MLLRLWLILSAVFGERPPHQTTVQAKVREIWAQKAKKLSEDARGGLLKMLDSDEFRRSIAALTPLKGKSAQELLGIMDYEVFVAAHIHNIPITQVLEMKASNATSLIGVDFPTVMHSGYIPTIWELIANGTTTYDEKTARGLDKCEVLVLGYPEISLPKPEMKQAWDRPVYNAINIWKRSGGNFEYGEVAFVLNEVDWSNKSFWSPIDSGWYCYGCLFKENSSVVTNNNNNQLGYYGDKSKDNCNVWDHASFGTHTAWYHLIRPHLEFWGLSLSNLFHRWYGSFPVTAQHLYLEAELSASFLIPEALKYMCAQWTLFGKNHGSEVQSYAKSLHRPLLWAKDYDSRMILDALVDNIDGEYKPQSNDSKKFESLWARRAAWVTAISEVSEELQLRYLGAEHRLCDPAKCDHCRFLGASYTNKCIFYR